MHNGQWYPLSFITSRLREAVSFTKDVSKPAELPKNEFFVDLFFKDRGRVVNCFFETGTKRWCQPNYPPPSYERILVYFEDQPTHFMKVALPLQSDMDASIAVYNRSLTEEEYNRRKAALTPLMRERLTKIESGNVYHRPYQNGLPKYVKELADAGLLMTAGRWVTVELCYVPSFGYYPAIVENFESYSDKVEDGQTQAD